MLVCFQLGVSSNREESLINSTTRGSLFGVLGQAYYPKGPGTSSIHLGPQVVPKKNSSVQKCVYIYTHTIY